MTSVIGVDIGGTKIAGLLTDDTYEPFSERFAATPDAAKPAALARAAHRTHAEAEGRRALLEAVIMLCHTLYEDAARLKQSVSAIGVGSAGQIDPQTGVVLDANDNLLGWRGTPLAATLQETFGVPVSVDNDVRTMALAECTLGAGCDYEHVLCLTAGTGIGGALVLHKQLWHGAHFSAGEFGYLAASPTQTIEQIASGPALERQYQALTEHEAPLSLRDMAARAAQGDEVAASIIQQGAAQVGRVLAPVMGFVDPQAVIIGGGLAEMDILWWQPLMNAIQQFPLLSVRQTPVLKATLGNRAGVIGAALLAMHKRGLE